MLKYFMRPKARRELTRINEERDKVQQAINRARKNKQKVIELYSYAQKLTKEAHYWEGYFR